MSRQPVPLLFIALFSLTISALTLPPSNSLSILNTSTPSLITPNSLNVTTGFGICPSPSTSPSLRPTFTDCRSAILHRLPYYPGKATFHSDGPKDAFRLPGYSHYGTCNITIVLGGRATEELSSWLDIKAAATELNEVCRIGEVSGGRIMEGEGGRIWIKLSRIGIGEGAVGME